MIIHNHICSTDYRTELIKQLQEDWSPMERKALTSRAVIFVLGFNIRIVNSGASARVETCRFNMKWSQVGAEFKHISCLLQMFFFKYITLIHFFCICVCDFFVGITLNPSQLGNIFGPKKIQSLGIREMLNINATESWLMTQPCMAVFIT